MSRREVLSLISTLRFAVVADDLSGGMVTGVQFALTGLRSAVVAAGHRPVPGMQGLESVIPVWDTASRAEPPASAYEKVRFAVRTLTAHGCSFFYKQSDSQLRGNLGAELNGLLDESGVRAVLCCFANPDIRRTTVGGYQLNEGLPVHLGPVGVDTVTPVTESHVPRLLAAQMGRPVAHLDLSEVRRGASALVPILRQGLSGAAPGSQSAAVFVADAVSEDDLGVLAEAALKAGVPAACGSYGLARAFARVLADGVGKGRSPANWQADRAAAVGPGGVLLLVGSTTALVQQQVARLSSRRNALILTLSPRLALSGGSLADLAQRALEGLQAGCDVAVVAEGSPESVRAALELGRSLGFPPGEVHGRIAGALGEVARTVTAARTALVRGIIATGGDTACAVFQHMSEALELVTEPIPGSATGFLRSSGTPFIAKSGACGGSEGLCILIDSLKSPFQGSR